MLKYHHHHHLKVCILSYNNHIYICVSLTVFEQPSSLSSTDQTDGAATTPDPVIEPTYFKEFLFYPSVVIKIDYEAKRFDMEKVLQCVYTMTV